MIATAPVDVTRPLKKGSDPLETRPQKVDINGSERVRPLFQEVDNSMEQLMSESIRERAGHLVFDVTVNVRGDCVCVRGKARSYYGWQLVQSACQRLLWPATDYSLDCAMYVVGENEPAD